MGISRRGLSGFRERYGDFKFSEERRLATDEASRPHLWGHARLATIVEVGGGGIGRVPDSRKVHIDGHLAGVMPCL